MGAICRHESWSSVLTQTSLPSTLTHVTCRLFTLILVSTIFS